MPPNTKVPSPSSLNVARTAFRSFQITFEQLPDSLSLAFAAAGTLDPRRQSAYGRNALRPGLSSLNPARLNLFGLRGLSNLNYSRFSGSCGRL